jgi:hypothetical protein
MSQPRTTSLTRQKLLNPNRFVRLVLALVVLSPTAVALSDKGVPPRISETQVTLQVQAIKGQGTVIAVADEVLTVVTAAHFLSRDDVGKTAAVHPRTANELKGQVLAVVTNPDFPANRSGKPRTTPAQEAVGIDTEIVRIKVDVQSEEARRVFANIRPAELAPRPIPGGRDQIVRVYIVDQFGEEHVVRAGNHLNPKCLAWGRSYEPKPGDSGAGVFIMRRTADGEASPLLIANVSQVDSRGGIASLVHRDARWIASAVDAPP